MNKPGRTDRGDLFVRINVNILQNLTNEEIKLFEKLKSLRS
jgi:DnaJ-class molecular chaperone